MTSASGSTIEEAEAFLAAHPEIVAFDLVLIDANGIARGKIVRRHELLPIFREGRHLPGSILGLDVFGEDVEATGLVWSDGDADRRAWPVPGTLKALPWTNPPRGEVQLSLYELDGRPMPADPRHALGRQVEAARREGFTPVMAFEIEFYLLDRAEGAARDAGPLPLSGERPQATQVYGLDALDRLEPFVAEVWRAADATGLPLKTLISEYARGQYEFTLHHRADALSAADDLAFAKRMLRAIAVRHGLTACFMAKPFADRAGSGMHCHASLAGADGANLFADPAQGELSPLLRAAIAGLLATLEDSMLVFAPHLNSWRRFAAESYAPTGATWGVNNRSVTVRVPEGPGRGRHLEQRMAGIDANPHLVAAVVLAGMRAGLAEGRDPGAPVVGNGYAGASGEGLPGDWRGAIERAATSTFLAEALGTRMRDVLVALKRAEWRRFAAEITPLERIAYGETV